MHSRGLAGHGVAGDCEEEEPIEGGFGRGRALLFRRIVDARGKAGAAEARAVWVRRIAKKRREQVMNALAFGGHGRLGRLDQGLDNFLLGEGVDELHG